MNSPPLRSSPPTTPPSTRAPRPGAPRGPRGEGAAAPPVEIEPIGRGPLPTRVPEEDPGAPEARLLRALVPLRVVGGRGAGLFHVLPVPRDVRRPGDEDVHVGLRKGGPLGLRDLAQLPGREGLHGPPVRLLVLEEEHGPRADGPDLVDELLPEAEPVVPGLDDHVLFRPDLQRTPDDVLREGRELGHLKPPRPREDGSRINR